MECTGGEEKYKCTKCCYIICYGDTLIKDRDLDHFPDTFQQDFGSEPLGKEK